jgi:hypothetical protein
VIKVETSIRITDLRFIHIVCNMALVLGLWDISPPSGHQFHVFEVSFFALEFEVSIDGDKESIQESV